jgi:hypothetical protein
MGSESTTLPEGAACGEADRHARPGGRLRRVLYVVNLDPSRKLGSLEGQTLTLARAFRDRAGLLLPLFLCGAAPEGALGFREAGLEVDCLDPTRGRLHRLRRLLHEGKFVLLSVAHLIRAKGVDVALRALAELPPAVVLWVAGEGEEAGRLRELCRDLGVEGRVRFLGSQPHVEPYLQAAGCFVCPSLGAEAAGLVNLEAQACGLPVLASSVGGIPEYVADKAVEVRRAGVPADRVVVIRNALDPRPSTTPAPNVGIGSEPSSRSRRPGWSAPRAGSARRRASTSSSRLPLLQSTGLTAGRDFFLAFSPEREDPGDARYSTLTIPKVVGGLEPHGLELAAELYAGAVVEVVRVSNPEVAQACKILENTYRAVNIALVNELKVLYDRRGIDVWEVIEAAKTRPFGFQAFSRPGPRRALHPHRPLLPHLGGPQVRPDHPLHRAGRRGQHQHAALRGGPGGRRPERARQAGQGQQGDAAGHGLQEGRRRLPRVARLRADGAAVAQGGGGAVQRPAHRPPAADAQPLRHRHHGPQGQAGHPATSSRRLRRGCWASSGFPSSSSWPAGASEG